MFYFLSLPLSDDWQSNWLPSSGNAAMNTGVGDNRFRLSLRYFVWDHSEVADNGEPPAGPTSTDCIHVASFKMCPPAFSKVYVSEHRNETNTHSVRHPPTVICDQQSSTCVHTLRWQRTTHTHWLIGEKHVHRLLRLSLTLSNPRENRERTEVSGCLTEKEVKWSQPCECTATASTQGQHPLSHNAEGLSIMTCHGWTS